MFVFSFELFFLWVCVDFLDIGTWLVIGYRTRFHRSRMHVSAGLCCDKCIGTYTVAFTCDTFESSTSYELQANERTHTQTNVKFEPRSNDVTNVSSTNTVCESEKNNSLEIVVRRILPYRTQWKRLRLSFVCQYHSSSVRVRFGSEICEQS